MDSVLFFWRLALSRWVGGGGRGHTLGWDWGVGGFAAGRVWRGEVGGDFCGEALKGFPSGFDEDVCHGWLFYRGEGDEDDFCAFDLRVSVGVFRWLG